MIDGQDISAVTQESLRSQIGMVTQDTALLHRSIRDNILFGREDASDEMLLKAAERAEALDFIQRLEDQRWRVAPASGAGGLSAWAEGPPGGGASPLNSLGKDGNSGAVE